VTWERRPVDPLPGPRTLAEVTDAAAVLNDAVALAGPETGGPGGFRFAESHMAGAISEETVLVDPHSGPRGIAAGIDDAAAQLGCDHVVLVDVGGDVLGHGHEAGLASPLCDAVLLAASAHMTTPCSAAVFGIGCDGELTPEEVSERIAEVWRAGGSRGVHGIAPAHLEQLEAAVAVVPTEASAMALLCARGHYGSHPIRDGRREVPLSPLGGLTVLFDPAVAIASAARCAAAVVDANSLDEADEILLAMGVRTELGWERDRAAGIPIPPRP
jgi:hypothetical protein